MLVLGIVVVLGTMGVRENVTKAVSTEIANDLRRLESDFESGGLLWIHSSYAWRKQLYGYNNLRPPLIWRLDLGF